MQANRHGSGGAASPSRCSRPSCSHSAAPATSSAKPVAGGPPDTYVANWDAVGTQAFTAAALSPAEGHTIFAYVGDRRLRLGDGDRGRLRAVRGRRRRAGEHVGRGSRRRGGAPRPRALPAGAGGDDLDPAYAASLGHDPRRARRRRTASPSASASRTCSSLQRSDDGFRATVTYTPPNPPIPGVWLPTAATPPIGPYLGLMRPFASIPPTSSGPTARPLSTARSGRDEYNEVKEIGSSTSTHRGPPTRRSRPGSGPRPRCSRHVARSASSSSTTSSTSRTPHGSWR